MLINRDNGTPYKTYEYLAKILNYGDIKLVVPEVVKEEIFRHIDETIDIIPKRINSVIEQVDSLLWFNIEKASFSIDKFNEKIKKVKRILKEDANEILSREDQIKKFFRRQIESLLNHHNTIVIDMNETILDGIIKRKILKRAPFHKKDSYADASIIETILYIKDFYQGFQEEDQFYFISRNYEDFAAGKKQKDTLHDDLKGDFERLDIKLTFSNLFYKTLKEDFQQEYIDAEDIEEEMIRIQNKQIETLIEIHEAAMEAEGERLDALEEYYKH